MSIGISTPNIITIIQTIVPIVALILQIISFATRNPVAKPTTLGMARLTQDNTRRLKILLQPSILIPFIINCGLLVYMVAKIGFHIHLLIFVGIIVLFALLQMLVEILMSALQGMAEVLNYLVDRTGQHDRDIEQLKKQVQRYSEHMNTLPDNRHKVNNQTSSKTYSIPSNSR